MADTSKNKLIGYECVDCGRVFTVADAPQGRIPGHKPVDDPYRTMDCDGSKKVGNDFYATVPQVRKGSLLAWLRS